MDNEEFKEDSRVTVLEGLMETLRWANSFEYGRDEIPMINENAAASSLPLTELGLEYKNQGINQKLQSYLKRFRCGKTSKMCAVCMTNFNFDDLMAQLPCSHFFHDNCISK